MRGPELVDVEPVRASADDDGRHVLAPVTGWDPEDERGAHVGQLEERRLHLGGRHVGASRLDHGAPTAGEAEVPVGAEPSEIPCRVPPVRREHLMALALVDPVHEEGAPDEELTFLPQRLGEPRLAGHDDVLHAREAAADGAAEVLGHRPVRVIGSGVRPPGLGHAQDVRSEVRRRWPGIGRERLEQCAAAHGAQIPVGEARVLGQLAGCVGPTRNLGHPLALDEVKCFARFEALLDHGAGARAVGGEHDHGESADPEERHGRVDAVVGSELSPRRQEGRMPDQ